MRVDTSRHQSGFFQERRRKVLDGATFRALNSSALETRNLACDRAEHEDQAPIELLSNKRVSDDSSHI